MRWRPLLDRIDRDLVEGTASTARVRAHIENQLEVLRHTISDLETILGGTDDDLPGPRPPTRRQ